MVEPFQNTEVYNIVCDSLGLEPKASNGTIRLPFMVSGLHGFDTENDIPDDLDDFEIVHPILPPEIPNVAVLPSSEPTLTAVTSEPAISEVSSTPMPESMTVSGPDPQATDDAAKQTSSNTGSWLDWFNGKLQTVKDWATDKFGSHKTNGGES